MNALPGHSMHLHITRLLHEARGGDREAIDRLFAAIYDELKVIARARLRRGRDVQSLDTTALVHEAYVRLFEGSSPDVADRAHFYALSSRAMRQVLVDHFRRRNAKKRARPEHPISLLEDRIPGEARGDVLLALDAALERLAQVDARLAQVVEYRFFGGMTEVEIGRVLNLTDRTVRNDWRKARAWLARELRSDSDNDAGRDEPL